MKNNSEKRILLIIPAYNEQEGIEATIEQVRKFQQSSDLKIDYVVINDGSTDDTRKILQKNNINHIDLFQNLGIGGAVQTGYRYAQKCDYDIAVQFDGDGQHDISYLPQLVAPILSGEANFSLGSRYVEGSESEFQSSYARRAGIKILSILLKIVTGIQVYDVTSGYRAADKSVIEIFTKRYPRQYPEPESLVLLYKKNKKIMEVPVNMFARATGESSITIRKSVGYMASVGLSMLMSAMIRKEKQNV
ncbi:hypothetical protein SAMN02745116_01648 [Pilibacter termitis]|uniref:Glycosyltransferase 2-like domain-containing protein n=1 Tax=Pilibacter termitis TaxID=263852 RepID=A0A1T4P474_9ENTE|nr:glycosyltransferase family 2 protein [Pilibacter termitis]SJZ86345.1 hypothetical protein SAMN02745116_01648 [Pilibacter termitis]